MRLESGLRQMPTIKKGAVLRLPFPYHLYAPDSGFVNQNPYQTDGCPTGIAGGRITDRDYLFNLIVLDKPIDLFIKFTQLASRLEWLQRFSKGFNTNHCHLPAGDQAT